MKPLIEVLDNMGGAVLIGLHLILRPLLRSHYSRWGATESEIKSALPGDERVPNSLIDLNLAVTVKAAARDIWPWIAQIGQERGGLYSYELLENMAGCKMHNAGQVVPEWELKIGDLVRFGPRGYPVQRVVALEHGQWLLLAGADPKTEQVPDLTRPLTPPYVNGTLGFYLMEQADGTTRLLHRSHLDYAPHTFVNKLIWQIITDPLGFVMTRKMMLTIKQRVESTAQSSALQNQTLASQN